MLLAHDLSSIPGSHMTTHRVRSFKLVNTPSYKCQLHKIKSTLHFHLQLPEVLNQHKVSHDLTSCPRMNSTDLSSSKPSIQLRNAEKIPRIQNSTKMLLLTQKNFPELQNCLSSQKTLLKNQNVTPKQGKPSK